MMFYLSSQWFQDHKSITENDTNLEAYQTRPIYVSRIITRLVRLFLIPETRCLLELALSQEQTAFPSLL